MSHPRKARSSSNGWSGRTLEGAGLTVSMARASTARIAGQSSTAVRTVPRGRDKGHPEEADDLAWVRLVIDLYMNDRFRALPSFESWGRRSR